MAVDRRLFREPDGGGTRVSLQYLPHAPGETRAERRAFLMTLFQDTASQLSQFGIRLDIQSLAVSGQNLEAIVPLDHYDEVAEALARAHIRMHPAYQLRATLSAA